MYRNTLTTITAVLTLTINLVFSQVVINEIHYNPGSAQGSDSDFEFLELYNPGVTDIDMSGYSFTQGVTHVFADGTTLAAGGYLVVAVNSESYPGSIEWTSGALSNGGEDIEIVDAEGNVVDFVDYEDGSNDYGDWGTSHDGGGGSLELLDAASDNSLATSWQTSWVIGGTPGAANSSEPDAVVTTIYNIQYTTDVNGASPVVGDYVQTSGVVTGVDRIGTNSAFTIQDGSGAWNGIYCWWALPDTLGLGDAITVRAYVVEYNGYGTLGDPDAGMTQLSAGYVVSHESEGNALPAAVVLDLGDVDDEQYEGVLVTTTGRVVAPVDEDSYGEWRISNNLDASDMDADTINVNDRFAVTSPPGGTIATVTGPVNQWGGSSNTSPAWKIEPATEADVQIACENADLTISIEMLDSFGDGWNGATYTIYGPQFSVIAEGGLDGGSFGVDTYCLFEYDAFSVVVGGGSYDEEISFNIVDAFGNQLITGGVANAGSFPPNPYYEFAVTGLNETTGCTDPTAVNYDYTAAVDDGSCFYEGEVCEHPISMSGGSGVAASDIDQFFTYTANATGNMTVSSVGQTQEDTYLVILSSCDIGYEYETDANGDTTYVTAYYEDVLAVNDDFDYGTGVYQSEATICVVAGETYIIAWVSMYYPYDESFSFVVEETPDVTVPVDVTAYGYEDGISVTWNPIPDGCAAADSRSSSSSNYGVLKFKPGARQHVVGKVREKLNSQRASIPVPTLTRDCDAGFTEVTFYMEGGLYQSERTYEVYDSEDNLVATATGLAVETPISVCLADGEYTVIGTDSWGDGWNGGVLYAALSDGSIVYSLGLTTGSSVTDIFTFCGTCVYGCTDPTANNYDATATNDDGSCIYPGNACDDPLVVDLAAAGVTESEANWFQVTIPTGGNGSLTISNNSFEYYYVYASCDGVANSEIIAQVYSSSEGVLNFNSETLNYAGDATMDTYIGATLIIQSQYQDSFGYERLTTMTYEIDVLGCTDPYSENYNADANVDDGSCICNGTAAVMNMIDSYGDGWNGNGYAIVNLDLNSVIYSGTLAAGYLGSDDLCLADGDYMIYVGQDSAAEGSYDSEISWSLAASNGQVIASGAAPTGCPTSADFQLPLPPYTFTLHRDGALLADELPALFYYDQSAVAGTDYCYSVSQTIGAGTPSGFSDEDCSKIYVPSTCATATPIVLDGINNIIGINGRDEWFVHEATLDGYLTFTSDIPGNDIYDNDTRFYVYVDTSTAGAACDPANLVQIGYDDDGGAGYLSTVTVVVDSGETYYLFEENFWSPGPSIFTAYEFPSGHQPPANFSAAGDHERIHLSWTYPLDAYSNALRMVERNGNTIEQNIELISRNEDITEKMIEHRDAMHEGWVAIHGEQNQSNSRDLTGTTIEIMGSVLNDDGTADIIIGLNMISPNNAWLSGVRFTFPDGMMVNGAVQNEGSQSSYDYCGEVYIEGSVVTFGDSAGVSDPNVNPDGDWGCLWGGFHRFTINVDAFTEPIEMGYLISDDCYLDFDGTLGQCGDIVGSLPVDVPTDEPLCLNDDFEPNDFFEAPDTWTAVEYPAFESWDGTPLTVNATVCPGDVDIYTVEDLGYGGWSRVEIIDLSSSGQMAVYLWDLSVSEYALGYISSDYLGDTLSFDYQNYGGIDGSQGPTQLVMAVEGLSGASQFDYTIKVDVDQPEVYSYNIHDGMDAVVAEGVLGYNYTHLGLTNGTEYEYYAVTVNADGLLSDTSSHTSASPRADQLFPPANLVGEPWLESVNLHWDAPPSLTPGNLVQSAFEIDMLPFEATGNTAAGFENNYDDCSDISSSPEAVYKYTAPTDTTLSISTCYSSFDTKVYVYENTTNTVVACNEDAGFYDYYYCGYYTSYSDSVAMTAGNTYYIVVDGWGGDAGLYNLQVFARGDTNYTEGWDYDMVVTNPNHDPEQKALAVQENLSNIELHNNTSRSLTGYEVLRENSGVWDVIATPSGNMYSDQNLTTGTGETYSYRVKAVYHGGTSDPTETVTVEPFAPIVIPTPVNFTASANGWIVELEWEKPDVGGGDLAYSETFDDGTLGTMTTEDLTPDGGPVWQAGTTEDATSTYWSPPDNGNFAFYNDDFHEYTYSFTDARLTSQAIDLSGFTTDQISGLSLMGELYFTQPSGPCDGGGSYAEELDLMVSVDGGDWESRGLINSTAGWDMVTIPLGLPGNATSAKVGLRYSDCGGNWGYGVAVDNFSVIIPPELDLLGYNLYKNGEMMTPLPPTAEGFLDVVTEEGTYNYGVSTVLAMYGESAQAGPVDVVVVAPAPAMNPPRNLVVEPVGLAADLEWDPPAGGDQWIEYHNGMIGNALGGEDAFDFQVAARFPAQNLVEFQGKHLSEIAFAGGSNISASSYSVQVHSAQPGQAPELIYESEIMPGSELEELAWNYYELEDPIPLALGQELWIGLRCISNGGAATYPAAVDNGETINGLGNMVNGFGSEGFVSLQDVFGLAGNWMISGYVSWPVTNVLSNSSFEGFYANPDGWQNFPNDFMRMGSDGAPYGNMFVDPDGAGIYGSPDGSTLDVYEGGHALKMWGMYAGGENMWGSVYQTFTVEELGGAGSMFDISAAMMSHAHDWIGQGTNSATVFASYWEGPYGYTYMGADYSNPFDGTFAASEWHEIGVMATIPEGATYVNIGIEILQPNNDQHGSIYFDSFVAAPYNPAVVEESVTPVAVSELGRKRTSDSFRDQGRPMLLFEEYIQENNYRDLAFEFLGYKVYRDGQPIDTLEMGQHMYYDVVGGNGDFDYHVSAMYEEDGTGVISEVNSNMVTVNLSNAIPTAVNLISPEDETVITLTPDNVAGSDLGIFWSNSSDADGDQVEYTLELCIPELGLVGNDCFDTTMVATNFFIPYEDLYEAITDTNATMLNISWNVWASDDWDEVQSANGPWTLVVDAGWMLSAEEELLPEAFALHNNYPNPFNPITNIRYDVPEVSDVRIDIYNINGQKVRTLVSREHQPGRYKIQWNATNEFGSPVASGMYIYKIHAKDFTSVKKLLLMK